MNKIQEVDSCFQQMKITFSYVQQLESKHLTIPPIFFREDFKQQEVIASVGSDVYLRALNDNLWEHSIVLNVESKTPNQEAFHRLKLVYISIVNTENVVFSNEVMSEAIIVKVSCFAFPFMRTILFNATRDSGIPPVLLDPIDFQKIYDKKGDRND